MPMNNWSWLVIGYVFLFGFFTPYILELPARLIKRKIASSGMHGRPVTRGLGLGLVFLLQALGFILWFILCLIPIKLSKDMNMLHPPGIWFGAPYLFGLTVILLVRKK